MNRRGPGRALPTGVGTLLLAACGLLTACGSAGTPTAGRATAAVTAPMSPGMVMPDGTTMGAQPPADDTAGPRPPALAVMVCGDEIRGDVAEVLKLATAPSATSTFVDQVYVCTYRLPMGPLVLSVKESPNAKAALSYYQAYREKIGSTTDVAGLGEHAYHTPDGTVGLVKDNLTLIVDATGLPAQFGAEDQKRTDLAYEVASVILGCWTGDDES